MRRLVQVTFNARDPRIAAWSKVFDTFPDWLRFAPNCWIVYTDKTVDEVFETLSPHIRSDEQCIATEIVAAHLQGLMPLEVWDWLYRQPEGTFRKRQESEGKKS